MQNIHGASDFFAFMRERHAIYLRRRSGRPWPWTDDSILQTYKFTNIFRELDKTTVWFREHVRGPMMDTHNALLATVLFRWFNRISTGEALFQQLSTNGMTAFEEYVITGDISVLRKSILTFTSAPYVTGAYIILGKRGYPKLEGVLQAFHTFASSTYRLNGQNLGWYAIADYCLNNPGKVTLEEIWKWICKVEYQAGFTAYEIVTDLRHTSLLNLAPDINTWANPGPGARRGVDRLLHKSTRRHVQTEKMDYWHVSQAPVDESLEIMRHLLDISRSPEYWPQEKDGVLLLDPTFSQQLEDVAEFWKPGDWPKLELRDIEHSLCETDKWFRVKTGQGRPRSKYRPPA